jgi:hypothetical protein
MTASRLQRCIAIVLLAAGCAWAQGVPPSPQSAPAPAAQAQAPAPSVSTHPPARPAPARAAPAVKAEASPIWGELNPQQQQSLAPLAVTWRTLSAAHKRKWIALSANYPTLPPTEQALLHSRMAEWAALSPQQRTQARLNFAATKAVPPIDKKAKWEAYQALPPEEKKKLAAGATAAKPPPPPTAAAVQPVPQQKLTKVPTKPRKADSDARIAVSPGRVDQNTLLPRPAPVPATAPAPAPVPAPVLP